MTEEGSPTMRAEWLLEPPGAGEVRVVVELGEGAHLTPDLEASLENLMSQLNEAEVAGFAFNAGFANFGLFGGMKLEGSCTKLTCERHDCERHSCDTYKSILRY